MCLRKRNSWNLALIIFLFFAPLISGIEISEVEINPPGEDSGNEWIEFYSKEEVDLRNYKIINNDGNEIFLEGEFENYFVYKCETQWLDNSDEKVFLYENNNLVFETCLLEDNANDRKTWNYCSSWEFIEGSEREENNCESENKEEEESEEIVLEGEESFENLSVDVFLESEEEEEIIYLSPQNIKSSENTEVLFESKNEKIKKYAIYGFALFCIFIIVLLIFDRR